ncbi:hypothetical protein EDB19DRAFT_1694924 [Suillus lakei]|nr:hypothetical protein EDB19DRAFT_1694924 [Suillus lakei]
MGSVKTTWIRWHRLGVYLSAIKFSIPNTALASVGFVTLYIHSLTGQRRYTGILARPSSCCIACADDSLTGSAIGKVEL